MRFLDTGENDNFCQNFSGSGWKSSRLTNEYDMRQFYKLFTLTQRSFGQNNLFLLYQEMSYHFRKNLSSSRWKSSRLMNQLQYEAVFQTFYPDLEKFWQKCLFFCSGTEKYHIIIYFGQNLSSSRWKSSRLMNQHDNAFFRFCLVLVRKYEDEDEVKLHLLELFQVYNVFLYCFFL